MRTTRTLLLSLTTSLFAASALAAQAKKPLDHSDYDILEPHRGTVDLGGWPLGALHGQLRGQ